MPSLLGLISCLYDEKQEERKLFPFVALLRAIYQNQAIADEELLRIYHVISNAVNRGVINYIPLLQLLKDYNGTPFYEFILNRDNLDKVLDEHELRKIKIIYSYQNQLMIEKEFWDAQVNMNYLLSGLLEPIWYDKFKSNDESWTEHDLDIFKKRKNILAEVFHKDIIATALSTGPEEGQIDNSVLSRALLTMDEEGDYLVRSGGNNWHLGYKEYWVKIFNNQKSSRIISELITRVLEEKENNWQLSYYNIFNSFFCEYLDHYDCNKKDARYYLIKYPCSLYIPWGGKNILYFKDGWNNCDINVLKETNLRSYNINVFVLTLFHQLSITGKPSFVENEWMVLSCGVQIYCWGNHSWVITAKKEVDISRLMDAINPDMKLNFIPRQLEDGKSADLNRTYFEYEVDHKKDLIEEGVKVAMCFQSVNQIG